ncbi:MAG TPA: YncE family protein [Gemmatimonadales bacterium]|jgi:YVTN family beta-propeller protein|nr:YncE family protein [Gemmatimonadales bacterium]
MRRLPLVVRLGRAATAAVALSALGAPAPLLRAQAPAAPPAAPPTAQVPYTLYVSSESADTVTRIEVGPAGWRKVRGIPVGVLPADPDGPHNVAVSPDGRYWYVSIAHGTPWGSVWKFATGTDSLLGRAPVGMFPTTVGLSPDGDWAFVPNSDFHGDRGGRNTLSVLFTPQLRQVSEIPVCDMPHGSRVNHAGTRVYLACMMSDELVVLDPSTFGILSRVPLGSGAPMAAGMHERDAAPTGGSPAGARPDTAHPKPGAASSTLPGQNPDCLATYVSVSPDDRLIYLACNHGNELQVRDAASFAVERRLATGAGAYNVEPSPDGKWVLVTNKKAQSVSVFDARTWAEAARIPTTKRIPHGIAFSPDGRYAFVTQESVGTDPGAVDAIDLTTLTRVASLPLPLQPTGIALWRGH